jgi:hypothetical protein
MVKFLLSLRDRWRPGTGFQGTCGFAHRPPATVLGAGIWRTVFHGLTPSMENCMDQTKKHYFHFSRGNFCDIHGLGMSLPWRDFPCRFPVQDFLFECARKETALMDL